MTVELLYLPGCPHHHQTSGLICKVLSEHGLRARFTETAIANLEEAQRRRFPGSPTVRVNGRDIEGGPNKPLAVGFACRTYWVDGKPQGVPPRAWLEDAIRAAYIEGR